MKFYIGTTNTDKIREIGGILSTSGHEYVKTDPINPPETESTFEGNAIIKAKAYARHCGEMTISEDSGLIVPHLHDLPGPYSARFSECEFDVNTGKMINHKYSNLSREEIDKVNCQKVLKMMEGLKHHERIAYFKVILVVCDHHGKIHFQSSGESAGIISEKERGDNGFGYDPIFIGDDTFGKTYAELDSMRKNLRSHRRHVLNKLKHWLMSLE